VRKRERERIVKRRLHERRIGENACDCDIVARALPWLPCVMQNNTIFNSPFVKKMQREKVSVFWDRLREKVCA
jgi:hypothetical protein